MHKWILCLLLIGTGFDAHAARYDSRKDVDRVARALESGEIAEEAQTAIDSIILRSADALRKEGRGEDADRMIKQYRLLRDRILGRWDLGDHRPLFGWLKRLYTDLESALGSNVMSYLHLTDLHIINHALPVVLNPWGRDWDRVEYRKHFVPLVGVLTYWSSFLACRAVIEWTFLQRVCAPAAGFARRRMEGSLAPWLSDRLYRRLVRDSDW